MDVINKLNLKLGLIITDAVGTMWCAYAFTGLALVSLPEAISGGVATIVSWVAQTFLQLVLLSVILFGQNVSGIKTSTEIQETHDTVMKSLALAEENRSAMTQVVAELHLMVSELHESHAGLNIEKETSDG